MWMFGAVLFALIIFHVTGNILKNRQHPDAGRSTIDTLNARRTPAPGGRCASSSR